MTKKLFCACDAKRRNKDAKGVWDKALMFGAGFAHPNLPPPTCKCCGYARWSFPSAIAVKRWYQEIERNPTLLTEVI